MKVKETVSEGGTWIRSNGSEVPAKDPGLAETTLTGEEKKIFDAVFVGAIIGAGLTALLFIFL